MPLDPLLLEKREAILRIAARHGAYNVRIFGSMARGEALPESDVDILVDMEPDRSLLDLGGLLMDLQDLFGCDVDVVTEKGLRARIRDNILRDAIPLCETTARDCSTSRMRLSALSDTPRKTERLSRATNCFRSGSSITYR